MKVSNLVAIGASAILTLAAQGAFASCSVNGSGGYSSPISTTSAYGFGSPSTLCGQTVVVTGSGGCVVNVTVDSTQSTNADCFAITKGVVLNMGTHFIDCSAGACGKGIAVTTSGASNDKVEINDGYITGPFAYGIHSGSGSNMKVTGTHIDLEGTGGAGIKGGIQLVDRCVVADGTGDGIDIGCNEVKDTIVRDFDGVGIRTVSCGAPHSDVDHCFIHNNGYGLRNNGNLISDVTVGNSTISDNTCDFEADSVGAPICQNYSYGINFTTPSFLNDEIVD